MPTTVLLRTSSLKVPYALPLLKILHHIDIVAGLCVADEEGNEVKEYFVDEGGNLTLPCLDNDREERVEPLTDKTYWIHEGKTVDSTVLDDDSLFLEHLRREDAGVYKCANVQGDDVLNKMRVYVRSKFYL